MSKRRIDDKFKNQPKVVMKAKDRLDLNNVNLLTEEVAEFVIAKFDKKYKKHNRDFFDSKKEMKQAFFGDLTYNLEFVIPWVLKNGHNKNNPDVVKIKDAIYEQLAGETGPDFTKYIKKSFERGELDDFDNIKFLPILLYEIISNINKENKKLQAEDPNAPQYDASDLYDLSETLLKKKLKKFDKKKINRDLAFDILSIIPDDSAMRFSPIFRVKALFTLLYQYASKVDIEFDKVIKNTLSEDYYDKVIFWSIRERKEIYKNFNERQKTLFKEITEWTFDHLNQMEKEEIEKILVNYIKDRKRDEENGRDENRRYFISSLPDDYNRIVKVVRRILERDASAKKYL